MSVADILSGRTVRAPHWIDATNLMNYVLAFGGQTVPFYYPDIALTAGGTVTLHHYVRRRLRCKGRVWVLYVVSHDRAAVANFDVTIAGTTYSRVAFAGESPTGAGMTSQETAPHIFIEDLAGSQNDTTEDMTVKIDCTAGAVDVYGVGCFELPRGYLEEDTTDYGTLPEAFVTGRPIKRSNGVRLASACKDLRGSCPRNGHFYWCSDDAGVTVSNTSYSDFFAAKIYTLPPRYARSDTTNTKVRVNVYAKVSAGTCTLNWQVTGEHASSPFVGTGTSSTAFGWLGATAVTLYDEDLTTSNGIQAGKTGQIQIQFKKTGVGNGLVRAISIYEDT